VIILEENNVEENNEKLTLEEFKVLGEALKSTSKNLKLIEKILSTVDIHVHTEVSGYKSLFDVIGYFTCDLENLSRQLEEIMDEGYPDKIIETIDFFN
jgi:hypothetical protein